MTGSIRVSRNRIANVVRGLKTLKETIVGGDYEEAMMQLDRLTMSAELMTSMRIEVDVSAYIRETGTTPDKGSLWWFKLPWNDTTVMVAAPTFVSARQDLQRELYKLGYFGILRVTLTAWEGQENHASRQTTTGN